MQIDFNKLNGLVPAIVQDAHTGTVLMLGFMNEAAYQKTLELQKVTFFSRTKNRLWTKGEESGHYLELISMKQDCDNDTILVKANPIGATCHTGTDTCWNEENKEQFSFLYELESIIQNRKNEPNESSYTSSLFKKGINKIAQKVGEEAVELVIEAKDNNADLFKNEAADLLYHYLILLAAKDFTLQDIVTVLKARHNK